MPVACFCCVLVDTALYYNCEAICDVFVEGISLAHACIGGLLVVEACCVLNNAVGEFEGDGVNVVALGKIDRG